MIEELKALAEKATPGPWHELCGKSYTRVLGPDVEVASIAGPEDADIREWNGERWEADARLICLLRSNLPAILSALEAVPVMKEALEAVRSDAQSAIDLYGKHGAAFTSPKTGNEYEPANYVQDKMAEFVGIAGQALAALEGK
jgi:hypothetical protein